MWRRGVWTVAYAGVLVLVVGLVSMRIRAEQPQASPQETPSPTIRVSTRLVLVDVLVTDKQGKPVPALKAEDFVAQEKGKNQKIAFFTPAGEGEQQRAAAQLPPGIYSNKPEYRSPGGPLTVLLLDAANTPFKDQAYARKQMLSFIKEQYKPGQRMAIFTLTNGLGVLQDFSDDPKVLMAALEQYKPQEQEMPKGASPPFIYNSDSAHGRTNVDLVSLNQNLRSFETVQLAYVLDRRVQITLAAMRSLARIMGGMPGRKSVVWVTAGFPFSLIPEDRTISEAEMAEALPTIKQMGVGTRSAGSVASTQRQQHAEEIRQVAAQLASAQVAIYPVDARGLVSGMEARMDDLPASRLESVSEAAQLTMSDVTSSQETMREMANETGGKAYINQNEIKVGVTLAMAENSACYTIGYYPDDKKWDGKYRSIKVKVKGEGLDVRHRRGYFAIDPTRLKDRNPEQEVAEALQDRVPDTLVSFSAQVKPTGNGKLGLDLLVDANTVSAEDGSSGAKKFNVVVYAAIFSPDGKMLGSQSIKVDQAFDAATYQQILQKGMLLHMDLDPQPGKNELRLAVRDNRTGHVGTLSAPLGQS